MKFIISIATALFAGIFLGHSSVDRTATEHTTNPQDAASKSSSYRSASRVKSKTPAKVFKKGLLDNSIQVDGVFGGLAEQTQRYLTMGNVEFEKEVAYLAQQNTSDGYDISYYLLFSAWGEKDPGAALKFLESGKDLSTPTKNYVERVVYKSWIAKNPDLAIAHLESSGYLENGGLKYKIATISDEWMKRDPEAAFTWLNNLESKKKEHAISQFFTTLVKEDSSEATEKFAQLKARDQPKAIQAIMPHWGKTMDWKELQSQVETLHKSVSIPDFPKETLELGAIYYYALENPHEATKIISDLDAPKKTKYQLIKGVAKEIGKKDPSKTLEWALSNFEGESKYQTQIADQVFQPWANKSAKEAAQWLMTQPDDAVTRHMYSQLVKGKSTPEDVKISLQAHFEKE